ncbi:TonB-dependent receptor [Candidatus Parabeggiatoa sp. HSG14]|uniref:TonB-dependent receptor plug domain-containing protein n=1 Tax=Candidatus Parabeggiatoa sp. HSG14 TaxID=3055593 RepID=UPI0025A768C7|nr:TonB-dependent receptor [Thiotrichales bacterium HSG14]
MRPTFATIENQDRRDIINQLKGLTLKELIKVKTFNPEAGLASRKVQKLTDTAAALFVLTQEDIRRAGITNLAEALRMVPGIQVARMNTNQWAISARGLTEHQASKLLVMIDGRTIYSPLYSDVRWDVQDLIIEDVERIEAIRGPGASLWGANAVNGIINIITKSAKNTQGNLVTTTLGKGEERAIVELRHGGQLGKDKYYRVYGKFYDHDSFSDVLEQEQQNDWQMKRGGFHIDWEISNQDAFIFQGDVYDGFIKERHLESRFQSVNSETTLRGFNLLARWQRHLTDGDMILQTYYDTAQRNRYNYDYFRGIYDIDFQHSKQFSEQHEFIWGLGFRYIHDDIENKANTIFTPDKRQDHLFSAFVQSEFMLLQESPLSKRKIGDLRLTLGSKFEHNNYTGFEIQPTARLLWRLSEIHSFWGAISRAVRTPSRAEEDIRLTIGSPETVIVIQGNPDLQSETLLAYELGYRFNLTNQFLFDMSLFYNDYNKLRTLEMVQFKPFPPPMTIVNNLNNNMSGEVYGLELSTHWQARKNWKLIATYNYLNSQLHRSPNSSDDSAESLEGSSPHNQANLRSLLSLPHQIELDTALYYVDNLSSQNVSHYTRFDVRLGWQPTKNVDISFGVRNLLDKQHLEFNAASRSGTISEISRAFYLQMKYRF